MYMWYYTMKTFKKLLTFILAIILILVISKGKSLEFDNYILPVINQFQNALKVSNEENTRPNDNKKDENIVAIVHENSPYFTNQEKSNIKDIVLSELDELGRAGSAMILVSKDSLPQVPREKLLYKPSAWHTYNTKDKWGLILDDGSFYLYHRCHLLAYSLSGLNDEPKNLITGTQQMNMAMLDYELKILDYVTKTGNSVLYRVSPYYSNKELLARGVLMEATSIEDNKLMFCVFIANKQNDFNIHYQNGVAEYVGGK